MRKMVALVGALAILAIGNTGAWALGPSFDCSGAQQPGARLICSSPDLSRTELSLMQAYNALSWQAGSAGAPSLQQENADFASLTLQQCGVPSSGPLPSDTGVMAGCVQRAYERQRDAWLSRLGGAAAEEGARGLGVHVVLQRALQQQGFLPSTEIVDGVYGPATRAAISAWQNAKRRPTTGVLSNADAAMLLAAPQAAANTASPAPAPLAPPAGQHGHASRPGMDDAGDGAAEWPFGLSRLEDMAARFWDRTGSGGVFMALGAVVLLAGFGGLFRGPSRAGGSRGARAKASIRPNYSVGRYSSGQRGPQLVVWGLLIVLSGACLAYGPTTVYQAVEQALTGVFA